MKGLLIPLLLLSASTSVVAESEHVEVIRVAIELLTEQGYTTAPIELNSNRARPELWDNEFSHEALVKIRYGSIEPCALEVLEWEGGWLVAFPLSKKGEAQEPFRPAGSGRYVFVAKDLSHAAVTHAWAPLPTEARCQ